MTSTTDTDEHPEVAEISALTDGLLPPARTAAVRDHLARCSLCGDVHASLEEIRGLLGTLPGPVRMPADVAGRIDAALAAEALLDATTPAPGTHVSRETPPLDTISVSRETTSRTRPEGHPRAATGPGRPSPAPRGHRPRRWPKILLGTAAAVAVLGVGGIVVQNLSASPEDNGQPQATASPERTDVALKNRVHALLTTVHTEVGARSASPFREKDPLPACVRQGTGRPEAPLASAHEAYEGKDAYLVILPHPSDPDQVSVYVVAASCVSASPPAPGKILLSRSYQRE
ncbi:hypothetical protein [Streptomyces sp. NPDC003077]|uniref:anti-sigma factor family protein n=1 Tax=Streptomyces sp. NPDC003077 TaxID=3154443 RepID=UPI0033AE5FFD